MFVSPSQACLLLSLESTYPPAHQLSLDMLKVPLDLRTSSCYPAFLIIALTSCMNDYCFCVYLFFPKIGCYISPPHVKSAVCVHYSG